jgi:peptide/nickel transport system substrate-binding protein
MNAETVGHTWSRRSFLKRVGLGTLSLASLSPLALRSCQAWAAPQSKRFIYAWTAFDILDPHVKYDLNSTFFTLNMYDNLLRYQKNPPETVPWLAEQTDVADGGRTWTFRLRRGVQFHDGSEVDAEAVRFSFERLLAIGKGPAGVFKRMGLNGDKVRAVGSHTVEIKLDRPYGAFHAAIPTLCIVNPAVIRAHEENGDWAEKWLACNEAGSGAFSLVKYDSTSGFVLVQEPQGRRAAGPGTQPRGTGRARQIL